MDEKMLGVDSVVLQALQSASLGQQAIKAYATALAALPPPEIQRMMKDYRQMVSRVNPQMLQEFRNSIKFTSQVNQNYQQFWAPTFELLSRVDDETRSQIAEAALQEVPVLEEGTTEGPSEVSNAQENQFDRLLPNFSNWSRAEKMDGIRLIIDFIRLLLVAFGH